MEKKEKFILHVNCFESLGFDTKAELLSYMAEDYITARDIKIVNWTELCRRLLQEPY